MERLKQSASGVCQTFPCVPAALFGPTAGDDGEVTAYFDNQLNQYTRINSEALTYDADGNMLSWNGWSYTWNRENRLIGAEKGSIRFEADYDYMGCRFEKKVYEDGVLTLHRMFAYDGYKLVAEFDALNDHALIFACLWQPDSQGLDVPLMMTYNEVNCYYIVDAVMDGMFSFGWRHGMSTGGS